MELALEFWSVPFRFLMNASANLLVFVAKCLGVSWDRLGLAWVCLFDFLMSFRAFEELSFFFVPLGIVVCALSF